MAAKSKLRTIEPLTPTQVEMFAHFCAGQHLICTGSAGTGKTYGSLYLALRLIHTQRTPVDHLIIVRSAVQTRDMGFLPGTLEDKMAPYLEPYAAAIDDLYSQPFTYEALEKDNTVHFQATSFLRGLTWTNAVVLVDEAQNMSFHELYSVVTRLGENSRLIVCGDTAQNDLGPDSGFNKFVNIATKMSDISILNFGHADIVRSDFVRRWIIACEEYMCKPL